MKRLVLVVCGVLVLLLASTAFPLRIARQPAGPGNVNLPYMLSSDNQGTQWRIYQGGWLQQQGNTCLYSQGAMLLINGNQVQMRSNRGAIDAKTGELVLGDMTAGNIFILRRILFNKEENYVRYIDILKNTQKQEQAINLTIQSNFNYGLESGQMVPDPKRKDQNIGFTAQTGAGRAVVEVFSGRGTKTPMTINWPQGNSYVQGNLQMTIPAGKEIAVMHLHYIAPSQDAGAQWISGLVEKKILSSVPREFRRLLVNFGGGDSFIGDYEILRGDALDILELRSGDQIKGTIKETAYKITTFYGTIELPASRIISLMNIGDIRPRQLLVTIDGEIFGGRLAQPTIAVELSSGQVTQIPLTQIVRLGYRKRPGEPEEWTFDKPLVLMRSGDRVNVQLPATPIEVVTRYGRLKLDPKAINNLVLQSEDNSVHSIQMTDGSKFAGLLTADEFELKLAGANGKDQVVHFPLAGMICFQFAIPSDDKDSNLPELKLSNDDTMIGVITGQLKLDTAFDTLTVNATEIQKLSRSKSGLDVQITLWDQTTVSGQLQGQDVDCRLNCGLSMKIPVSLIDQYTQPVPQPSNTMLEKIKTMVSQLNADDWKQREQAEAQLVALGSGVAGPLRQMRPSQPPEAQQRIDSVLKKVEKEGSGSAPAPAPMPMPMQIDE